MGPKPNRPSNKGQRPHRPVRPLIPEQQWTAELVQEEVCLSFGKSESFSSVISLFPEFTRHEVREFPRELLGVLAGADPARAELIARQTNSTATPEPFRPVHRISTFTTEDMATTELATGHALEDAVPNGAGENPDPAPGAAGQGAPLESPGNLHGDESNTTDQGDSDALYNLLPNVPPPEGAVGPEPRSTAPAGTALPISPTTLKRLHLTDPSYFGLPILQYCGRQLSCPDVDLERLSDTAKTILSGLSTQPDDGTSLTRLIKYLALRLVGGTVSDWALPCMSVSDWKNFFMAVDKAEGPSKEVFQACEKYLWISSGVVQAEFLAIAVSSQRPDVLFPDLPPGAAVPTTTISSLADLAAMAKVRRAKESQGAVPKGGVPAAAPASGSGRAQVRAGTPLPTGPAAGVGAPPGHQYLQQGGGPADPVLHVVEDPTWETYSAALCRADCWNLDPASWSQNAESLPLLGFLPTMYNMIQVSVDTHLQGVQALWTTQMGLVTHKLDTQQAEISAGRTHSQGVSNNLASHAAAVQELKTTVQTLSNQIHQSNFVLEKMAEAINKLASTPPQSAVAPPPTVATHVGFAQTPQAPVAPASAAVPNAVTQLLAQVRNKQQPQNPFAPQPLPLQAPTPNQMQPQLPGYGFPAGSGYNQAMYPSAPAPLPAAPRNIYCPSSYSNGAMRMPMREPEADGKLPGMSISSAPRPQTAPASTQFQYNLGGQQPTAPPMAQPPTPAPGSCSNAVQTFLALQGGVSR